MSDPTAPPAITPGVRGLLLDRAIAEKDAADAADKFSALDVDARRTLMDVGPAMYGTADAFYRALADAVECSVSHARNALAEGKSARVTSAAVDLVLGSDRLRSASRAA